MLFNKIVSISWYQACSVLFEEHMEMSWMVYHGHVLCVNHIRESQNLTGNTGVNGQL
jgi:hypothetical protein